MPEKRTSYSRTRDITLSSTSSDINHNNDPYGFCKYQTCCIIFSRQTAGSCLLPAYCKLPIFNLHCICKSLHEERGGGGCKENHGDKKQSFFLMKLDISAAVTGLHKVTGLSACVNHVPCPPHPTPPTPPQPQSQRFQTAASPLHACCEMIQRNSTLDQLSADYGARIRL